jgi:hypothetical protein
MFMEEFSSVYTKAYSKLYDATENKSVNESVIKEFEELKDETTSNSINTDSEPLKRVKINFNRLSKDSRETLKTGEMVPSGSVLKNDELRLLRFIILHSPNGLPQVIEQPDGKKDYSGDKYPGLYTVGVEIDGHMYKCYVPEKYVTDPEKDTRPVMVGKQQVSESIDLDEEDDAETKICSKCGKEITSKPAEEWYDVINKEKKYRCLACWDKKYEKQQDPFVNIKKPTTENSDKSGEFRFCGVEGAVDNDTKDYLCTYKYWTKGDKIYIRAFAKDGEWSDKIETSKSEIRKILKDNNYSYRTGLGTITYSPDEVEELLQINDNNDVETIWDIYYSSTKNWEKLYNLQKESVEPKQSAVQAAQSLLNNKQLIKKDFDIFAKLLNSDVNWDDIKAECRVGQPLCGGIMRFLKELGISRDGAITLEYILSQYIY